MGSHHLEGANAPPQDVEVSGVESGDTERIEERLSPDVASAVPRLAREIHARLRRAAA